MLMTALRALAAVNTAVLRAGRFIAWVALAVMVAVILAQVFFRYALNAALPWPEEAARFLMLWMVGLVAPSAYRWGGFVAIDMFRDFLPKRAGEVLMIALQVVSLCVLIAGLYYGYAHTFGFGGNFNSSSLRLPLDLFGMEIVRVKLRYMYGALLLCVALLAAVNVELILRGLLRLSDPEAELPGDDSDVGMVGAD